jgi:hypothetical protein
MLIPYSQVYQTPYEVRGGDVPLDPSFTDDVILFATFEGTADASAVGHTPIHAASGVTMTVQSGITYNSNGTGLLLPNTTNTVIISVTGIPQRSGAEVREIMITGSADITNYDDSNRGVVVINEKSGTGGHAGKFAKGGSVEHCLWNGSTYTSCFGSGSIFQDPNDAFVSFVGTMHDSSGWRCAQAAVNHNSYDGTDGAKTGGLGGDYPTPAAGTLEVRMNTSANLANMNLFSILVT